MEEDEFLKFCPEEPSMYIDWEGIKYHPDTNVSMKVVRSLHDRIVELLSAGFHSISVTRGVKGFPRINYKMPGFPTIWEEWQHMEGTGLENCTLEEVRGYLVEGRKEQDRYLIASKLGRAYDNIK